MEKEKKTIDYRVEKDSIGTKDVPEGVYYGVQSLRAAENFHITGLSMHPEIINSLAYIKKAAAITNCEVGIIDKKIANAIVKACDEILEGKFHKDFIVDPIQGGAGTSLNMNANEVIANRAIELLGGQKGDYSIVNPNDHVNCSQSTNDVIPTAGKMTSLRLLKNLKKELRRLYEALSKKADEFDHVIKMGRTQMQDAVPIRLGQEFKAYSVAVMRDINRMDKAMDEMRTLNMGGTAVGTGINADEAYLKRIVPNLVEISGGGHGLDGLAVHEGKDGNLTAGHELLDDQTISGRAEFLVGHDLLDALFCLIEVLANQNAFSESQAVGFENDGEISIFQISERRLRAVEGLIGSCGNLIFFHQVLGKCFGAFQDGRIFSRTENP